jgi:hypothetical protein
MKKKRQRAWPLGPAVLVSLLIAFGVGCSLYATLYYCIPNSPVRLLYELWFADPYPELSSTHLFQALRNQVDNLEVWLVEPLCMLSLGFTLACLIGEEYGVKVLYGWALGTSTVFYLLNLSFLVGVKLAAEKFHVKPWDFPLTWIAAELFVFIFWLGVSIVGVELGRRIRELAISRKSVHA